MLQFHVGQVQQELIALTLDSAFKKSSIGTPIKLKEKRAFATLSGSDEDD